MTRRIRGGVRYKEKRGLDLIYELPSEKKIFSQNLTSTPQPVFTEGKELALRLRHAQRG